uniref:COesterase domain-containing protein n=1 Tax=Syphacia muris TaxID=451379 RepID=A0A0N5A857_9BILA
MFGLLLSVIWNIYILQVNAEFQVTVESGTIVGKKYDNYSVVGYLGIPYAEAPVGEKRLQNPVKFGNFDGAYTANKWSKRCHRFRNGIPSNEESEDCLYLNILLPTNTSRKPHLLVVFTNGGLDETILLNYIADVRSLAFAVVHFRQGPLGFFADESPGIADVKLALQWLKKNSDKFGYVDITVMAENDDASVLAYALAQIENDVFSRAILLNGNTAVRRFKPEYRRTKGLILLLKATDCLKDKLDETKACVKALDIEELIKATRRLKYLDTFGSSFRPKQSVDDKIYPVLMGFQSSLSDEYRTDDDFDVRYSEGQFNKFLSDVFSEKEYKNAAFLRKLAYHHYLLHDRDIIVPTRNLVFSLRPKLNPVYVLEYVTKNPIYTCLNSYSGAVFENFCGRIWKYFTRFATHGEPAETKCSLEDPSFPRLMSTKRDYYLRVDENGAATWEFQFYQSGYAFWNNLVPLVEKHNVTIEKTNTKQAKTEL